MVYVFMRDCQDSEITIHSLTHESRVNTAETSEKKRKSSK